MNTKFKNMTFPLRYLNKLIHPFLLTTFSLIVLSIFIEFNENEMINMKDDRKLYFNANEITYKGLVKNVPVPWALKISV